MISIEERAAVIWEELTLHKQVDPVAWLAEALRQFEREITNQRTTKPLTMAAVSDSEE